MRKPTRLLQQLDTQHPLQLGAKALNANGFFREEVYALDGYVVKSYCSWTDTQKARTQAEAAIRKKRVPVRLCPTWKVGRRWTVQPKLKRIRSDAENIKELQKAGLTPDVVDRDFHLNNVGRDQKGHLYWFDW